MKILPPLPDYKQFIRLEKRFQSFLDFPRAGKAVTIIRDTARRRCYLFNDMPSAQPAAEKLVNRSEKTVGSWQQLPPRQFPIHKEGVSLSDVLDVCRHFVIGRQIGSQREFACNFKAVSECRSRGFGCLGR